MRDDVLAERALSVLMPADRAAATVGDLLEVPRGSRARFWRSILSVGLGSVVRDVASAPMRMGFMAVVAWFGYMLMTILLLFLAYTAAAVLLLALEVVTPHTGLELIADWLPWDAESERRFFAVIEAGIVFAIGPFVSGRHIADFWQERAMAFLATIAVVWSSLVTLVPFVAFVSRVEWPSLPVVLLFLLLGAVTERHARTSRDRACVGTG